MLEVLEVLEVEEEPREAMQRKLTRSRNRLRRYKPAPELRQARRVTERLETGIVLDHGALAGGD